MSGAPIVLKRMASFMGVYPAARSLYRRMSPSAVRERRNDRAKFAPFVRPGDLVFDVGANLGQSSEAFLALGARVVALEPNPRCAPILNYEFGREDRFTLVPKAAGRVSGRATLNVAATDSVASLRGDWQGLAYSSGALERIEVEVTTLDALMAQFGTPDFCKIDVEGFETEVFAGLSTFVPTVSFEYHRNEADRAAECLRRLTELGTRQVNLVAAGTGELFWADWRPIEQALDALTDPKAPKSGDLFAI